MKGQANNIVIINPDQMRWDYTSSAGHSFINTQGVSRLAEIGVDFRYAFVASPGCGPSRTSFVSGAYPNEHGVRNYAGDYDENAPNILKNLEAVGYRRALFGKDHIIKRNAIGVFYDEGEDICLGSSNDHPQSSHALSAATLKKGSRWDLTERLTDQALDFIERQAGLETPFYVTINYQDPHPLFACPEPYASMFDPAQFSLPPNFRRIPVDDEPRRLTHWRIHSGSGQMDDEVFLRAMAMYCGQIRYVDRQVERVLDKLEELRILDRTIVLFWSDHGEFLGDFGVARKLPVFYDCLVRVPMVLFDPSGMVSKRFENQLVEAMDIMATVADLAGVSQPEGSRANSLIADDFSPREDVFAEGGLIKRQPQHPIPNLFLKDASAPTNFGPGAMLRTKRWKLCRYAEDKSELFDLENDPHEQQNLSGRNECHTIEMELNDRLAARLLCRGQAPELLR